MSVTLEARDVGLAGRLQLTSMTLAPGTVIGLIGPNGSGKTSLLHALAGIGKPFGSVMIDGLDLRRVGPAARSRLIGFVPARRELIWPLRPRELIALGGATQAEADAVIHDLALSEFARRPVNSLSTGERSRVLIARALAPRPKVLLLDEPTANLDPLWQIKLMTLLKDYASRFGTVVVMAIHDIDAAMRWSDRLLVVSDGSVVADGSAQLVGTSDVIEQVFGVRRSEGRWIPSLSPREDRRSLP